VFGGEMVSRPLGDFMKSRGLTAYRVAKDIGVPALRINQIVRSERWNTCWRVSINHSSSRGSTPTICEAGMRKLTEAARASTQPART
jgi:hypothetical protein